MKNIAVFTNIEKDPDLVYTMKITSFLMKSGVNVFINKNIHDQLKMYNIWDKTTPNVDLIIVLGGDGTILGVARDYAHRGIPIFGINMGHLGFLAETDIKNAYEELDKILQGNFKRENRMMLKACVTDKNGRITNKFVALNDMIISRGIFMKTLKSDVFVNEEYVNRYLSDGIIVCTPTGSTAYNLSAQGPIMQPTAKMMAITAISPHSLSIRPFIAFENDEIVIRCSNDFILAADGQEQCNVSSDSMVTITKSPYEAIFIKTSKKTFFDIFREKIVTL